MGRRRRTPGHSKQLHAFGPHRDGMARAARRAPEDRWLVARSGAEAHRSGAASAAAGGPPAAGWAAPEPRAQPGGGARTAAHRPLCQGRGRPREEREREGRGFGGKSVVCTWPMICTRPAPGGARKPEVGAKVVSGAHLGKRSSVRWMLSRYLARSTFVKSVFRARFALSESGSCRA